MNYWPGTSIPISRHNGFDLDETSPWTERLCSSLRKSETSRNSAACVKNKSHLSFDSNSQASADRRAAIKKASI